MKIRPLHDRVLVELDAFEESFGDSGLVRPDIARDKPRWGTVRGVGPGVHTKRGFRATTLHSGDRVLVPWRSGKDLLIGGRLHVFVHEFAEGDIVAREHA